MRAWHDFHACNWHQKLRGVSGSCLAGGDESDGFVAVKTTTRLDGWTLFGLALPSPLEAVAKIVCVLTVRLAVLLPCGESRRDWSWRDTLVQYAVRLCLDFILSTSRDENQRQRRNSIPITLARTVLHLFFFFRYGIDFDMILYCNAWNENTTNWSVGARRIYIGKDDL